MNWGRIIDHQQSRYDDYMQQNKLVNRICAHYQIKPAQLTMVLLMLLSICISTGFGVDNMVSCFTYLYIARRTLAALYQQDIDQKYMIVFWFCYATLRCLEDVVHLQAWFPYYILCKTAFLYFLVQPKYKAAIVIHTQLLQPAIDRLGPYFAQLESDTKTFTLREQQTIETIQPSLLQEALEVKSKVN